MRCFGWGSFQLFNVFIAIVRQRLGFRANYVTTPLQRPQVSVKRSARLLHSKLRWVTAALTSFIVLVNSEASL